MPPLNCTPVTEPSGRTIHDARTPSRSAVYIPAGAETGAAVNAYFVPFMVRSPVTSLPLNDAASVSWNFEVMSIAPLAWLPKNHASSSMPLQAYAAIWSPSTEMPMVIFLPSASTSAMYLADGGNAALDGVTELEEDASVVEPLVQAERVPMAKSARTPTISVRRRFLIPISIYGAARRCMKIGWRSRGEIAWRTRSSLGEERGHLVAKDLPRRLGLGQQVVVAGQ